MCEIETSLAETAYRYHQSQNILPSQSETSDETIKYYKTIKYF